MIKTLQSTSAEPIPPPKLIPMISSKALCGPFTGTALLYQTAAVRTVLSCRNSHSLVWPFGRSLQSIES